MAALDSIGDVAASEMVEGWDEDENEAEEPEEEGQQEGGPELEDMDNEDVASYTQVAAKTGPMTLFASHLARLQAHLESMTVPQRANVIKHLYDKLEKWRGSWVMALTSVSRDRADRLWALLVTYQGEPGCIEDKDAKWADDRWEELVAMLQIDAVQAADIGAFRLPGTLVEIDDSQAGAPSSSSNQVMVRRTEHGPWEQATDREVKELAQKDEDDALLRRQQEAHDEALWQEHQAAKAQEWDDWAVASEMGKTRSMQSPRPAKRFRVRVSVFDKDHNELDTADLHGDIDANDQPLVSFTVMEEEVNRTPDDVEGPADEAEGEKAKADEGEEQGKGADQDQDGDGRCDQADQAETEAVASAEGDVDELVDPDIAGLGSVPSWVGSGSNCLSIGRWTVSWCPKGGARGYLRSSKSTGR